jgi:hypothetical protein
MITIPEEYLKGREELAHLEAWLQRLESTVLGPQKRLTKAGLRKKIARLREEIGVYEGSPKA